MRKLLFFGFFLIAAALMNAQRPIITKWNTNVNNDNSRSIIIPTDGGFTYTYVKADNSSITGNGTGNNAITTISFPQVGECIVSITPTGTFKFQLSSSSSSVNLTNRSKIIELSQWGDVHWNTDFNAMFTNCDNLKITAIDIPDFSNITRISWMFNGCSSLTTVPCMNSSNTSSVISMHYMFSSAKNFN